MLQKIRKNSLLSGSAIYLLSNILAASIPFALLPILTRYLSPSEYGQVAIFQTLLAGLGAFLGLSVQGSANRKFYDAEFSKSELKYFIGSCFLILAVMTFLTFFSAIFFRDSLSNWVGIESKWLFLSVVVASGNFIIGIRTGQWQVRKQAKKYGVFQVSLAMIGMIFSLLLVIYFLQGSTGRIWALSIAPLVYAVISLLFLYKDGLLGFAWRPNYLREILSFGVPLIPHSIGLFLLSSVDRFVINEEMGLAEVGIYMVAVQLTAAIGLIFGAVNSAYMPWLFERLKRDNFEEKKKIVQWTYYYYAGLLCIVVLAFLVGPSMLILVAGEKYSAAKNLIGWLALGQAFNGMYLMTVNYIFYSKRTGLLSLSTIAAGAINITLLIFLISLMGLRGAAVAFSISMAIKFFLTWYIAQLRYPMPWFSFRYNI
jgi:O-antigen/teichoic acid export membrane protein